MSADQIPWPGNVSPAAGRPSVATRSPARTGVVLGLLMGPSALGVTAAAVAIPNAADALGRPAVHLTWPLSVYIVCLALASAVGGRLLAVAGGRAVLRAGATLLTLGALGTLLASSLGALTVARAVLAAGAGLLAALSLGAAGESPAEIRPRVLSALAGVMAMSVGIGPILGGLLAEWAWPVAFATPVLALLAVPGAAAAARAVAPRPGTSLDLGGLLLTVLAAGGLIVLLQAAASGAGGGLVGVLVVVTVVAAAAVAVRVPLRPAGFLPMEVVGRRDLAGWWLAALGAQAGQIATLVLVPVVLTGRDGWSAPAVGLLLAVLSIGGVVASRAAAAAADQPRGIRVGGWLALLLAAALVVLALVDGSWPAVVAPLLGFSTFSTVQVVAMHHVSGRVPGEYVTAAAGFLSLVFLTGGAIGSALASLAASRYGFADAGVVAAVLPLVAAVSAFAVARRGGLR